MLRKRLNGEVQNLIVKTVGSGRRQKLLITVDMSRSLGMSKTGKSVVIATSGGNKPVPDGNGAVFNINVMLPLDK